MSDISKSIRFLSHGHVVKDLCLDGQPRPHSFRFLRRTGRAALSSLSLTTTYVAETDTWWGFDSSSVTIVFVGGRPFDSLGGTSWGLLLFGLGVGGLFLGLVFSVENFLSTSSRDGRRIPKPDRAP
uniref:Uncharacterized protein n=1 Tax=Rhodosorus marinus TaxID=101924 RepID=A0A7S2ZYQ6_9RHOD